MIKNNKLFKSKVGVLLATVPILIGAQLLVYAQGICIPKPIKVTSLSGRIMFPAAKGEEPVSEAIVELREYREGGRVLKMLTTNTDGCFNFGNLKSGKYKIHVKAKGLHQMVVEVRLVKGINPRKSQRYVVIALGADALEPCGGGYSRVGETIGVCGIK